jgi:hypothetical protein
MGAALMARALGASRHRPRPIDAGGGVAFQSLDRLGIALGEGLLCGAKLGSDAPPLLQVPSSPGKKQACACGEKEKHLRHRLESETRPERARFDRGDEVGGKSAG